MRPASLAIALAAAACASLPSTDGETDAKSLAQSETAFAAHSVREDMRAAFLANFSDDGVLVRGGWTLARPSLASRPAPPIVLDWRPVHVEVARSGELGLSTGPWKLAARDAPAVAKAHGQFVSIWRREPNGTWKVLVDIGIANPGAALWDENLRLVPASSATASAPIEEVERAFARDAARDGLAAAYAKHAAERLRLYRPNAAPFIGKRAALAGLVSLRDAQRWTVEARGAARSGDFAYVRGRCGNAPRNGWFLRVWRAEQAGWRIVLDVTDEAA